MKFRIYYRNTIAIEQHLRNSKQQLPFWLIQILGVYFYFQDWTLTGGKKTNIIQGLQQKQSTLQIAKLLCCHHPTIKKYATNPQL